MKRQMIRPILGLLVAGLALGVASQARADGTNIGVIDLQRALMQVNEGRAAKVQLQAEFKEKQKLLDKRQDELKSLQDDLQKRASTMDPAKRREKQAELQRKYLDLRETYMTLQKQLMGREKQLTSRILQKMQPILQKMAAENNLDAILTADAVAWAKPDLDLTNELIRRYNARFSHKGGKSAKHHHKKTAKKK